ncbi:MAG TPA: RDD family protein [Enhygromyxa sp.]|nr:RDD family protein [Enhygromyxa sp.]
MRLWPPAQNTEAARVEAPRKRVPIRRRPMPCPHCDAELLDLDLAASAAASCPSCGLPLRAVEVAGFWRRSAGGLIDLAILLATAGPIAWGLHRLVDPVPIAPGARGLDLTLSLITADFGLLLTRAGPFLVLAALYLMVTVFWTGQTFGQRLLSMRVIDRHGRSPSLLVIAVRTLAQLAGTLAAAFGPLWIAIDSERRAVHDVVAGTYVVRSA